MSNANKDRKSLVFIGYDYEESGFYLRNIYYNNSRKQCRRG